MSPVKWAAPVLLVLGPTLALASTSFIRFFSHTAAPTQERSYNEQFPLYPELWDAYEFWSRVYGEWQSENAFIHRDRSYELQKNQVGAVELYETSSDFVKKYSNLKLKKQAYKKGYPEYWRMQRGSADLVLTAVQTYHYFRNAMEEAISGTGAPTDLLALGFLESLYTPDAVSRTGAIGAFQIQPWEAHKLGAVMGPAYNQLYDPITSARLAMSKLTTDRQLLLKVAVEQRLPVRGSMWPLVLSGYNQGIYAISKAMKETRSSDYLQLVFLDKQQRFGFSGRNFYTQFRLFADLLRNSRATLDKAGWPQMDATVEIGLGAYLSWPHFVKACGFSPAELKPMNLAITDLGWNGVLRLPPEAQIRFPRRMLQEVNTCLAGPASGAMHQQQAPLASYRVKSGETLTSIASKVGSSPFHLMQVNSISREQAAKLKIGALIKIPTRAYAQLGQAVEQWAAKGRPRPSDFFAYRMKAGDKVALLEKRFGLASPELSKWNDLTALKVGQVLYIPRYP